MQPGRRGFKAKSLGTVQWPGEGRAALDDGEWVSRMLPPEGIGYRNLEMHFNFITALQGKDTFYWDQGKGAPKNSPRFRLDSGNILDCDSWSRRILPPPARDSGHSC